MRQRLYAIQKNTAIKVIISCRSNSVSVSCLCGERTSPSPQIIRTNYSGHSSTISGSKKFLLGITYPRLREVHLFISKKIFNVSEASYRSQVVTNAKLVVQYTVG